MTPEMMTAIFAGVTLLIYFTGAMIGGVVFLWRKIDEVKASIDTKHQENRVRVDALQALVIRHETMLSPEFNGIGKHHAR